MNDIEIRKVFFYGKDKAVFCFLVVVDDDVIATAAVFPVVHVTVFSVVAVVVYQFLLR